MRRIILITMLGLLLSAVLFAQINRDVGTISIDILDILPEEFDFESGSYTITVYSQLAGDQHSDNDTLQKMTMADEIPPTPSTPC